MTENTVPDEVEFATSTITIVDEAVIDRVRRAAHASPRRRARLCLHPHLDAPLHNMLIVLLRGTDVALHQHLHRAECYHIVSGRITLIIGDDTGHDRQRILLGPGESDRPSMCRIAAEVWHRVEVESDEVVMHESTVGPFNPSDTIYFSSSSP